MTSFSVDRVGDGRAGVLEIDDIEQKTPSYIPTRSEYRNLENSQFVEPRDYQDIYLGVHGYWLGEDQLLRMSADGQIYQYFRNYVRGRLESLPSPMRMIHFEFNTNVEPLTITTLKLLLNLQYEVGANVIQIPNCPSFSWDYGRVVDTAIEWQREKFIEQPLMGVVCSPRDVRLVRSKIDQIKFVGAHLRRENFPMLYTIEEELKPLNDVWIHAFSAPRTYRRVSFSGTLGVLINTFGIDSISCRVGQPVAIRNFVLAQEEMTEEEKIQKAFELKYFNPQNYSTFDYSTIEADREGEVRLSEQCTCPICQNNSIQSITFDFEMAYTNTRAHEALSHIQESRNIQENIQNNNFNQYLGSKEFARRLSDRSLI